MQLNSHITKIYLRSKKHFGPIGILLAIELYIFRYIFQSKTMSAVGSHIQAMWPWKAIPTHLKDSIVATDQANSYYPWSVYISRNIRNGYLSFWNSDSFVGNPLSSNGQSSALYPIRLLFSLFMDPSFLHDWMIIFHLFLGGLGMYFLLIRFKCSRMAAVGGALFWIYSSPSFMWMQFQFFVVIVAYLPFIFIYIHRLIQEERKVSDYFILAILISLMLSGSNIQFTILGLVPAFLYLLIGLFFSNIKIKYKLNKKYIKELYISLLKSIKITIFAGISTICIGAVFILPVYLETKNVGRTELTYAQFISPEVTVSLKEFFKLTYVHLPLPFISEHTNNMMYEGIAVMVLSIIGALFRGKNKNFSRFLIIGVFLLIIGTPFAHLMYKFVPGAHYMQQIGRILFLFSFAIAILAAFGIDHLVVMLKKIQSKINIKSRAFASGLILVMIVFVIGIGLFEQVNYGLKLNPKTYLRTKKNIFPDMPVLKYLESHLDEDDRIVPIINTFSTPVITTMFTSQQMVYGIPSIAGYDSIASKYTVEAMRISQGEPIDKVLNQSPYGGFYNAYFPNSMNWAMLREFGVTHLLAPPDIDIQANWKEFASKAGIELEELYRGNDGVIFRIQESGSKLFSKDELNESIKYDLRDFSIDPKFTVIDGINSQSLKSASKELNQIPKRLETDNPNEIKYSSKSDNQSWLYIPVTYNEGWSATINGKSIKIHRANHSFMAIEVPKGDVNIEFNYLPQGFKIGIAISVLTFLFFLVLIFYPGSKNEINK